jgi:uncharacterized membrane protein
VLGALATTDRAVATGLSAASVAAEVSLDKLPNAPSRLDLAPAAIRLGSGGIGGYALARRSSEWPLLPTLAGVAGAALGTAGGAAWRGWAEGRMPRWASAVAEDLAAGALTVLALRGGSRRGVARVAE